MSGAAPDCLGIEPPGLTKSIADAHSFVATPTQLFVDARHNDYRLSPSSPAIDHGTTLADVPTDIAGVARPQGAYYDVGAYEFAGNGMQPESVDDLP